VFTGMFFSNLVMFFIILTTAATLHAHGVRSIETAKQASEALRPLAGNGAYWLFTLGLIGTGALSFARLPVCPTNTQPGRGKAFLYRQRR
jgi:Mn2+/Fe2+ NRAMP family transporter